MIRNQISDSAKDGALAAGSVLAAIGASSCCVLPLALVLAGVGGAWVGNLTALAPYQPIFIGAGALAVAWGFWRTSGQRQQPCEGGQCGTPRSRRWSRAGLWLAAILLVTAATTELWGPFLA